MPQPDEFRNIAASDLAASWDQKFVAAVPLHPALTGLLVSILIIATYAAQSFLTGFDMRNKRTAIELSIYPGTLAVLIQSAVIGLALFGAHQTSHAHARELEALAGTVDDPERQTLLESWLSARRHAMRRPVLTFLPYFLFGGVFVSLIDRPILALGSPAHTLYLLDPEYGGHPAFSLLITSFLFALLGTQAAVTVSGLRAIAREVDKGIKIDLLCLSKLFHFGRIGLHTSVIWIVMGTLLMLIFAVPDISLTVFVPPVLLAVVVIAFTALLLSVLPVHRQIVAAKSAELNRLATEINRDREAVAALSADAQHAAERLPGLLAYRAQIEAVREWPLDTPTLTRFGLYLALPLGSWFGGALVEQALAWAID